MPKIQQQKNIDDVRLVKHLTDKESPFIGNILTVFNGVKEILDNRIQRVFGSFTLHNTAHSIRIMEHIYDLIDEVDSLSDLEVTLLIYSSLLHDIGMAVSEEDIESIQSNELIIDDVSYSSMLNYLNGDECLATQEYIRRFHGNLSARYIRGNLSDKLTIPGFEDLNFTDELATICESHTKSTDWIKTNLLDSNVRGDHTFNAQFLACALRLGDILDFDGSRTPYNLYKLIAPTGISDEEWRKHFVIANNKKIEIDSVTSKRYVVFHGKSKSAQLHRKVLQYTGWVEEELKGVSSTTKLMQPQYRITVENEVKVYIQTEGYTFSDYKMTLNFAAISTLLMGESIYGSKKLGLRELIQNSIDACRVRKEIANKNRKFGEDSYSATIKVILDQKDDSVTIKDNGCGMSLEVIKKHFLNLGSSFYKSKDFALKGLSYSPIGNYGIGFLSCFMLSDCAQIKSRNYESKNKYTIDIEKGSEWTSLKETPDVEFEGTEFVLNYSSFIEAFDNEPENVKKFLESYFVTDDVTLELIDRRDEKIDVINNSSNPPESVKAGISVVMLNDFLTGIEGYALIKRKSPFVENVGDLNVSNILYEYDFENGLVEVDDPATIPIEKYLHKDHVPYVEISFIDSSSIEEFRNGLEFTNYRLDEVLDRFSNEIEWVTILNSDAYPAYGTELDLEPGDEIFDGLLIEDLAREAGFDTPPRARLYYRTKSIYKDDKTGIKMPFAEKSNRSSFFRASNWTGTAHKLFIRNVLVPDYHFTAGHSLNIFSVDKLVINVTSAKVTPDISRNNINQHDSAELSLAVSKAIHRGAAQVLDLSDTERNALNAFVSEYYPNKTEHQKESAD